METAFALASFIGGIGLFYYGLRSTTEVIQLTIGEWPQKSIDGHLEKRLASFLGGFLTGLLVIHPTVGLGPILGLLNRRLISLVLALSFILGANVGSSLIVFLFLIDIHYLGIMLIALAFLTTLTFSHYYGKQIGKLFFSLGFLFLGLETMRHTLLQDPFFIHLIQQIMPLEADTFTSSATLFFIIGILTLLLGASGTIFGLLVVFSEQAIFTHSSTIIMVISANLAIFIPLYFSIWEGSSHPKRAVLALLGMKIFLSVIVFFFIYQMTTLFTNLIEVSLTIPLFHTLFNIVICILFYPFLSSISRFMVKVVPQKVGEMWDADLLVIDSADEIWPSMGITQLQQEVKNFKNNVKQMFLLTQAHLRSKEPGPKDLYRIKDFEIETDRTLKEISKFANRLTERALTAKQSLQIQNYVRMAFELESIADYLERAAVYRTHFQKHFQTDSEMAQELFSFIEEVYRFFSDISEGIETPLNQTLDELGDISQSLKKKADFLRDKLLTSSHTETYRPLHDRIHSDLIMAFRKIRSHSFGLATTLLTDSELEEEKD